MYEMGQFAVPQKREKDMKGLETLELAKRLRALPSKSFCVCGHLGDGSFSEHKGHEGHGHCTVWNCKCSKFTFLRFTPEAEKHMSRGLGRE